MKDSEHERGWGTKVCDVKTFATLKEAEAYAESINGQNTAPTAPDYYETAEVKINR